MSKLMILWWHCLFFFFNSFQNPFRVHGKKQEVCLFHLEQDELCRRIACFSHLAIMVPCSQQQRCKYLDESNSGCFFSPRYKNNVNPLLKASQNCRPEPFPTKWISIMFSSGDWTGLCEIYWLSVHCDTSRKVYICNENVAFSCTENPSYNDRPQ